MVKLKEGRRGLMRNGEVTGELTMTEEGNFKLLYGWTELALTPSGFSFSDDDLWYKNGQFVGPAENHQKDIICLIPKGWIVFVFGAYVPMSYVKLLLRDGTKLKRHSYTFETWPGRKSIAAFHFKHEKGVKVSNEILSKKIDKLTKRVVLLERRPR